MSGWATKLETSKAAELSKEVGALSLNGTAPSASESKSTDQAAGGDPVVAPPAATSGATSGPALTGKGELHEHALSLAEASLMRKKLRTTLVTSKHEVEVQRKDPRSPLYSVTTFEQLKLRPELLSALYAMGFDKPSKIQETALPTLLADPPQNMIAQSQSGTGKTAAFMLASLSRVVEEDRFPQVLIICPTYELALQIEQVGRQMSSKCPRITFRLAVKGEQLPPGSSIEDPIIIGTPGKLIDWAFKYKFFDISKIRVFVLDEADVMIAEQGHHDQSIRLHKKLSSSCQMMLFSATYDEAVMEFAQLIIPNPIIIRLRKEEESLDNIRQLYVECANKDAKLDAISNLYGVISVGQCIIFCQTRQMALWLSNKLIEQGHGVAMLSGELTVEQRVAVIDRFRNGLERVLVTTNVCARGIDVEQVTMVINFDLPVDQAGNPDYETYLHRIGRTGRFGKVGVAINMVDGSRAMDVIKQIEKHFGKPINKLDTGDIDEIEKIGE